MKKTIISAAVSISLVGALAACSSPSTPSTSGGSTSGTAKKVELTLWNTFTDDNPANKIYLDQIKKFNEQNKDIVIKAESIPHDQYKTKLKTQAAGKQLPSIVQVWPGAELTPLVKGGVLQPIDEITSEWKDLIPADSLKDYQVDGKQYAIPTVRSLTHVIYYNKDLLAKAGYNEFPKTYTDLKTLISKLNEQKVTPIALGNKGKWVLQSCYMSTIGERVTGPDFLSLVLDKKEKSFTDPEFVKALNIIKELTDLKAFNPDMNNIDTAQQEELFIAGKSAMFIEGTWAFNTISSKMAKDLKLGFAFFPEVEGGKGKVNEVSGVTGIGFALNAELKGDQKQAAQKFLKFFHSQEVYKSLLSVGELNPAKVDVPSDINPNFNEMLKLVSTVKTTPVYDAALPIAITDIINNGLQGMTVQGGPSAQDLAKEMQDALNKK
jgi:raffinose/stachyose/melibiose transport system substrate-binding protein